MRILSPKAYIYGLQIALAIWSATQNEILIKITQTN